MILLNAITNKLPGYMMALKPRPLIPQTIKEGFHDYVNWSIRIERNIEQSNFIPFFPLSSFAIWIRELMYNRT